MQGKQKDMKAHTKFRTVVVVVVSGKGGTAWDWRRNRRNSDISEASMIKPVYLFLLAGGHRVLAIFAVVSELNKLLIQTEKGNGILKKPRAGTAGL